MREIWGGSALYSALASRAVFNGSIGIYSVVGNDFDLKVLSDNDIIFLGKKNHDRKSNIFIIDEKKKALADGVITKEEMETVYKEVKASVVKKAKEMISQWPLFAQFLVEDKVEDFVESAVKKVKNEGKTINPS